MRHNFNFKSFCDDHSISHVTEGHKHCQPGWIQVECPFCTGNPGWHLGWNILENYFNCWRCGTHGLRKVVSELLKIPWFKAKIIEEKYQGRPVKSSAVQKVKAKKCELPHGSDDIQTMHKNYLKGRRFNAERLTSVWDLKGTGSIGPYKFRIIAPIFFEGQLVSYQGRDITDRQDLRYKACPSELETRDHKHCLYGLDENPSTDTVVIVEGITDVWRLGPGAVATFGIKYTHAQLALLRRYYYRYVMYDKSDPQAVKQGLKLANVLSAFHGQTEIITIEEDDPAQLKQDDADAIMFALFDDRC